MGIGAPEAIIQNRTKRIDDIIRDKPGDPEEQT